MHFTYDLAGGGTQQIILQYGKKNTFVEVFPKDESVTIKIAER